MSRITVAQRAPMPVAYRPVEPIVASALGVILLGLGSFFSVLGDAGTWDWQIDLGYWSDLLHSALGAALDFGSSAAGILLSALAQTAYSSLADSAPILLAALLLALFALGPSEIMTVVGARARQP